MRPSTARRHRVRHELVRYDVSASARSVLSVLAGSRHDAAMSVAGRVVVLNGPSSAGKTTLATAVRDALGPSAAAVSLDQFFPCIASTHPNNWHLFVTLTEATFAAAAALAKGGLDVIVDTVFERPDCVVVAETTLSRYTHYLVAVTAALDVLEARERARGDRRHGQARAQLDTVFHGTAYDLRLDTGALSVDACVDRIRGMLALAKACTQVRR